MSEVALLEKISEIFIDNFNNNLMLISGKCQICMKETGCLLFDPCRQGHLPAFGSTLPPPRES